MKLAELSQEEKTDLAQSQAQGQARQQAKAVTKAARYAAKLAKKDKVARLKGSPSVPELKAKVNNLCQLVEELLDAQQDVDTDGPF